MNARGLLEFVSEAATLGEAIDKGLTRFNCQRTDIETEILQVPTAGYLGWFGRRPARVRIRLNSRIHAARLVAAHLMSLGGFSGQVHGSQSGHLVEIDSPDAALIIGRQGQGIEALQHLVNLLVDQILGSGMRIEIDCSGYRSRRIETLNQLARTLIDRVGKGGRPVTTPPLHREDRQVLNRILEQEHGMNTRSVGSGPEKKLVVSGRSR